MYQQELHPAIKKPKLSALDRLKSSLKSSTIPFSDLHNPATIQASLDKFGAALVPIDPSVIDIVAIKTEIGTLLAKTFPDLSLSSKSSLKQGNFEPFNNEWKKEKVINHKVMLHSCGMPTVIPIHKDVVNQYYDENIEAVVRFNPVVALAPGVVWSHLPPGIVPVSAYVSGDGIKTTAGRVATPLHYDGDHALESKSGKDGRVQCIMVDEAPGARHIHVIPNTATIRLLLGEITGTMDAPKRGFHTLNLSAFPDARQALLDAGQTLNCGLILFRAGTFHHEAITDGTSGEGFIFRAYCGYLPNARSCVETKHLITMAFLRLNEYAMDPYSIKTNGCHPLFFNDKKTQYQSVKVKCGDKNQTAITNTSLESMKSELYYTMSSKQLALYGLSLEDVTPTE